MKDIETVVFQDKSWVRLSEYQKLQEENQKLQEQIEKMKCCKNCAHYETTEDYRACRDKCVKKTKNGPWILTNWELYKD